MSKSILTWQGKMAFDIAQDNHHFMIDASPEFGGEDQGLRPKTLLLSALGGCSGMDIVSILKKMRIENYSLTIKLDAEQSSEHPIVYTKIFADYYFEGDNLPLEKLKKAVVLSETRYCGVNAMLSKAAKIESRVFVNGTEEK